ncbi:MAG: DNA polymerase III subunit delta' [Casimicrobiaceae bacterium]
MMNERESEPARLPWSSLLPWQHEAARAALARRATWPHALLIYGPHGIGKHALALNFAQALLCEIPRTDGLACGECAGCRYAVAGQHLDLMRLELLVIDPEEDTLGAVESIGIDRVRSLTEFVQLTSHRHRAKVAVIAPAERMNAAAANALLKTLEEPPPGTYLLLVSDQPGRVPATLRSRCRLLAAPVPLRSEAVAWLAAQGVAAPELALAQASGAPVRALAQADPIVQDERRTWLAALGAPERLSVGRLAARIDAGGRDERRARLAHALEWLIAWTADLARIAAGDRVRQNPDAAEPLQRLAARVAPIALFRYHRSLLRQRAMQAHPLQPRLVAEALLLDYRALF